MIRENNYAAGKTWVWTYDDAGNILSKTEYAYTTGTLGTALDTIVYTYGNTEWGDLLTAYDGMSITYDALGNPLTMGTARFLWEHGRQLAAMNTGSSVWWFTYDAGGMRTGRTMGNTVYTYVYNGSQLSQMTYNGIALYFTYDASGAPATVTYDGTTYYYALNLQGDVIAILDSTGTAVVEYTYDAWGKLLTIRGTMGTTLGLLNPLRYRGYVYDQETGLYYLQSRYYNPIIGRFINADAFASTGGLLGNNMFAYCYNNPVHYIDSSGGLPIENDLVGNSVITDGSSNSRFVTVHYPGQYEWIDLEVVKKQALNAINSASRSIKTIADYVTNTDEQVVLDAEYFAFYRG